MFLVASLKFLRWFLTFFLLKKLSWLWISNVCNRQTHSLWIPIRILEIIPFLGQTSWLWIISNVIYEIVFFKLRSELLKKFCCHLFFAESKSWLCTPFCVKKQLALDIYMIYNVTEIVIPGLWRITVTCFWQQKNYKNCQKADNCKILQLRSEFQAEYFYRVTVYKTETALSIPYARHYNPLLIRNRSWILTIHKAKGHST